MNRNFSAATQWLNNRTALVGVALLLLFVAAPWAFPPEVLNPPKSLQWDFEKKSSYFSVFYEYQNLAQTITEQNVNTRISANLVFLCVSPVPYVSVGCGVGVQRFDVDSFLIHDNVIVDGFSGDRSLAFSAMMEAISPCLMGWPVAVGLSGDYLLLPSNDRDAEYRVNSVRSTFGPLFFFTSQLSMQIGCNLHYLWGKQTNDVESGVVSIGSNDAANVALVLRGYVAKPTIIDPPLFSQVALFVNPHAQATSGQWTRYFSIRLIVGAQIGYSQKK